MAHSHCQHCVGTCLCGQPLVSELGVVGVVGAHGDNLGTTVADLETQWASGVRVSRTFAPHMMRTQRPTSPPDSGTSVWSPKTCGGSHGEVSVPVVEAGHHATHPAGCDEHPR